MTGTLGIPRGSKKNGIIGPSQNRLRFDRSCGKPHLRARILGFQKGRIGTLGIPRDSKKGMIGTRGLPGDSRNGLIGAADLNSRVSKTRIPRVPTVCQSLIERPRDLMMAILVTERLRMLFYKL